MGPCLGRLGRASATRTMGQRIFLARHGERADLADPSWLLSKPDVRAARQAAFALHRMQTA